MGIASNTNYAAPVVSPDLGNPTKVAPADLANGFVPGQPVAAEHINYCLSKLEPSLSKFTANGTWTKPTGATAVRIVCVGGGGKGGTGIANGGGNGGSGGEVIEVTFDAAELASTLAVTVGAASTSTGVGGGASYVTSAGITLVTALGGATGDGGAATGFPSGFVSLGNGTTIGGLGGANSAGANGNYARTGAGGDGGAAGSVGSAGRGYGAGGGGGRQLSGLSSGGGGGGGGYGASQYAGNASTTTGGNGAPGVVFIFTDSAIA